MGSLEEKTLRSGTESSRRSRGAEVVEIQIHSGYLLPEWIANVVMVPKPNGTWRMCVDYTDINKACPKDNFSLPKIDRLVDYTARNALLSFMDAYSSFH